MEHRNPIYRDIIDHPAAWTSASLGSDPKRQLTLTLSPEQRAAIDRVLRGIAHMPVQSIERKHAADPVFEALARDVEAELADGRGLIVVHGIDRAAYSNEECERIFWALGTHMGDAAVQNKQGDQITHVTQDKAHPTERGYRSSAELSPHTDAYAILGLMCLDRSESGGFSHAASALAIHNEILGTRPDLLPALYEGTHYATLDARGTSLGPTPEKVPLFSCVDGKVSVFFSRQNSNEAVRQSGEPLDPAFAEGADLFERLARDERFRIEFMLDPGEIMFVNNYVLVHARTEFEDSERHKRDLLRLWLNNAPMRPVLPELHLFAKLYKDLFALQAGTAK